MAFGNKFIRIKERIISTDCLQEIVRRKDNSLEIRLKGYLPFFLDYNNESELLIDYNRILKQLGLNEVDEDFNDKIKTPLSQGEYILNRDRERVRFRPRPTILNSKYL